MELNVSPSQYLELVEEVDTVTFETIFCYSFAVSVFEDGAGKLELKY